MKSRLLLTIMVIVFLTSACGGEAAQPSGARKYASAQEIAEQVIASGINCLFSSNNKGNVPIYDKGRCTLAEAKDRDVYGEGLLITVELVDGGGVATDQLQASRKAYWEAVKETMASLGQTDYLLLTGPNWFISGGQPLLTEVQKVLGGEILDVFSESDKEVFINR